MTMKLKKLFKKDVSQVDKKRTRRQFLILLGMFSLTLTTSLPFSKKPRVLIDNEKFFLVDGWVLKKEDIYDL